MQHICFQICAKRLKKKNYAIVTSGSDAQNAQQGMTGSSPDPKYRCKIKTQRLKYYDFSLPIFELTEE